MPRFKIFSFLNEKYFQTMCRVRLQANSRFQYQRQERSLQSGNLLYCIFIPDVSLQFLHKKSTSPQRRLFVEIQLVSALLKTWERQMPPSDKWPKSGFAWLNVIQTGSYVRVFTWTIDDKPTMEWLIRVGVDGIISNKPKLLASVWANHQWCISNVSGSVLKPSPYPTSKPS